MRNWSASRRFISLGGNLYVRLVLGVPVHETTAGFKAFRREALDGIGAVSSASNGYCFQIENTCARSASTSESSSSPSHSPTGIEYPVDGRDDVPRLVVGRDDHQRLVCLWPVGK